MFKLSILILLAFVAMDVGACNGVVPQSLPIDFRRTGGIVGFNDHLVVDAKGHATLTRRTGKFEFDLSGDELKRLYDAFRDAGYASIPEDSMPKPYLVPDELSYVIVYQGHTVKTSDTAIPAKLEPVMQLLNGIVDSRGR